MPRLKTSRIQGTLPPVPFRSPEDNPKKVVDEKTQRVLGQYQPLFTKMLGSRTTVSLSWDELKDTVAMIDSIKGSLRSLIDQMNKIARAKGLVTDTETHPLKVLALLEKTDNQNLRSRLIAQDQKIQKVVRSLEQAPGLTDTYVAFGMAQSWLHEKQKNQESATQYLNIPGIIKACFPCEEPFDMITGFSSQCQPCEGMKEREYTISCLNTSTLQEAIETIVSCEESLSQERATGPLPYVS